MKNNLIFGSIIVIVSVLFSSLFLRPVQQVIDKTVTLGSASSPSVVGGCMDVNGVTHCYASVPLRAATTTPCAMKSPSATSTLLFSSLALNVATATAVTWSIATSTSFNATTSVAGTFAIAANATTNMSYALPAGTQVSGVAPNTYVVWGMQSAGAQTLTTANLGQCKAEFIVQ